MIIPIKKESQSEVAEKRAELISLRLLRDLHNASERHLPTSAGMAALASIGIADRTILRAYRIGYLPANFRLALNDHDRRTLAGRRWAGALLFPAFDTNGAVVDVFVAQTADGGHVDASVWDSPRGMLAPTLATAFPRLTMTDSHRRLGELFQLDVPALLMRGIMDAQQQATRLIASGVTHVDVHVRQKRTEYEAVLRAAGFVVDGKQETKSASPKPLQFPPVSVEAVAVNHAAPVAEEVAASPPTLELLTHDRQREQASFQYQTNIYEITGVGRGGSICKVTLIAGDARHPHHGLDIAVSEKRRRFALAASQKTNVPRADIETALQLIADVLPTLRQTQPPPQVTHGKPSSATTALSSCERAAALARLRDATLFTTICESFEVLGWHGDANAKALAVLGSISRLADEPLWLALVADDDGERFPALRCLAAMTPADQCVHVSRLTDTALFHAAPDAFRHRLFILDDLSAISPAAETALRVLHAHGSLSGSTVERDVMSGGMRTNFHVVHGPLAMMAAAPEGIPQSLQRQILPLQLDTGIDVAEKQLAAKRRAFASPQATTTSDLNDHPLAVAWRQALSLLETFSVIIPESEHVALPAIVGQNRCISDAAFTLITAHTLLHQHQRMRSNGSLIATAADITMGVRLATHLAASRAADLSSYARQLLTRLWAAQLESFTMDDVTALLPACSRWSHRAAVDELMCLDYVDGGRGGRGRVRDYRLVATVPCADSARVGSLAGVGGAMPPTVSGEVQNA